MNKEAMSKKKNAELLAAQVVLKRAILAVDKATGMVEAQGAPERVVQEGKMMSKCMQVAINCLKELED